MLVTLLWITADPWISMDIGTVAGSGLDHVLSEKNIWISLYMLKYAISIGNTARMMILWRTFALLIQF